MANLIPTPIVDKNGVASLRHKKLQGAAPGAASLARQRPSLGSGQSREVIHQIKGKALHSDSTVADFLPGDAFHPAMGKAVNVPDDVVYDFLRLGLDANEAAAFTELGLSAGEVEKDDRFKITFRTNLNRLSKSSTSYSLNRGEVLDRFQESGVSGIVASKVISNGLQDEHLDRALDDDQLIELFSKWKFRGVHKLHKHGGAVSDDIIEAMVDGDLPFESKSNKIADLEFIEREINSKKDDPVFEDITSDPEYFAKLVNKAAMSIQDDKYNPLWTMHKLAQNYGPEVFDLDCPEMADIDIYEEHAQPGQKARSHKAGVEGARYIEAARQLANERNGGWGYSFSGGSTVNSSGAVMVDRKYLRNYELLALHEMGVPVEEAYTALIDKEMRLEQIKIMKADGIASTLADGVL